MPWYLCYPFVSIKFPSLAAVIEGWGVKIVMMGSSILDIGESFLFLIIWVESASIFWFSNVYGLDFGLGFSSNFVSLEYGNILILKLKNG